MDWSNRLPVHPDSSGIEHRVQSVHSRAQHYGPNASPTKGHHPCWFGFAKALTAAVAGGAQVLNDEAVGMIRDYMAGLIGVPVANLTLGRSNHRTLISASSLSLHWSRCAAPSKLPAAMVMWWAVEHIDFPNRVCDLNWTIVSKIDRRAQFALRDRGDEERMSRTEEINARMAGFSQSAIIYSNRGREDPVRLNNADIFVNDTACLTEVSIATVQCCHL